MADRQMLEQSGVEWSGAERLGLGLLILLGWLRFLGQLNFLERFRVYYKYISCNSIST
jgi:hypothetical protein